MEPGQPVTPDHVPNSGCHLEACEKFMPTRELDCYCEDRKCARLWLSGGGSGGGGVWAKPIVPACSSPVPAMFSEQLGELRFV